MAAGSGRTDLISGEYDALRWYDLGDGGPESGTAARTWNAGDLSVGEPTFAPAPGSGSGPGSGSAVGTGGFWLTFATDRTDGTSWLLVLPAEDPARGPVAASASPSGCRWACTASGCPRRSGRTEEKQPPSRPEGCRGGVRPGGPARPGTVVRDDDCRLPGTSRLRHASGQIPGPYGNSAGAGERQVRGLGGRGAARCSGPDGQYAPPRAAPEGVQLRLAFNTVDGSAPFAVQPPAGAVVGPPRFPRPLPRHDLPVRATATAHLRRGPVGPCPGGRNR